MPWIPSARASAKPPADLAQRLSLTRGEHVLAAARSSAGEWYVGSNLALHLPDGERGHRRVGWEDLERAEWRRDTEELVLVEVTPWGEPERTTVVAMDDPGRLLELVRERVTKSILVTVFARVRRRAGLTVVGRRSPSGDGPITWSYVLAPGLDPDDPEVVIAAEEALAQARQEVENL